MDNIKEKIQKLLALSTSSNEHEARAALLKAKELMAKNKLTEADFEETKAAKMVTKKCNVKWTTDSGDIWAVKLCKILCDNYCCVSAWETPYGTRTHTLVITGFEDDVQICKVMTEYAFDFVKTNMGRMARRTRTSSKSYAQGFLMGLEFAFEEQKEEHPEWALVVQKPQEVQDYESQLSNRSIRTKRSEYDPLAYIKGEQDGRNFNARKVIETA